MLEEKKESIRQISGGEKSKFHVPGIGKILVSARRTKFLKVNIPTIFERLNHEQLKDLVDNEVLSLSLKPNGLKKLQKI